jgi:uncharacterized delta-60 repeat protein
VAVPGANKRRGYVVVLLAAATALMALPGLARAAAGDLDLSFSGDGIAVIPGFNYGMALDSRGRTVVVSGRTVERFLPDGTLDTSFSGDGTAAVPFSDDFTGARSVAVDSHDRIVVAGGSNAEFAVGRLTENGAPDRSFSGDGQTFTKIGRFAAAWAVGVDPQGRIVAAGGGTRPGEGGVVDLARYLPNGAPDHSFSGDGKQHSQFPDDNNGFWRALAFDSRGRIVVAGTAFSPSQTFILARYTRAGELDPSFSGDGLLTTKIGPGGPFGDVGLAVDGSNRILFAGDDEQQDSSDFAVARLRVDGDFDPSFSGDGKVLTSFGRDFNAAYSLAIDHAQRIVAVGLTGNSRSPSAFALARYTPAGRLDPTFSGDGKVTTSIAPQSIAEDAAIDPSGRIVVSGQLLSRDPRHPNGRIAVARYLGG